MTTVLETTARATDARHLELDAPLMVPAGGKVRVIVQVENNRPSGTQSPAPTVDEWLKGIPSLHATFPAAKWPGTDEFMREAREGDRS